MLFQAGFRKIHANGHPLISYREVMLRKVKFCSLLKYHISYLKSLTAIIIMELGSLPIRVYFLIKEIN